MQKNNQLSKILCIEILFQLMLPSKRLFLGIPVIGNHQTELIDFQDRNRNNHNIRWVSAENLHITVHFFGDVPTERVQQLRINLAIVVSKTPSFKLDFNHFQLNLGKSPTMLWAVYNPQESFFNLHKVIAEIAQASGLQKTIIHCTLARFKPKSDDFSFNLSCNIKNPYIEIRQVILYESVLHPAGSIYKELDSFNLL